jgi:hydroxybutyrate-dimer hydrolase
MKALQWFQRASVLALAAIALPANADQELRVGMAQTPNVKPTFLGEIRMTCYDGVTDDLLTAGLGKTGLAGAAPEFISPLVPTPAGLRRRAIWTNKRASCAGNSAVPRSPRSFPTSGAT